MSHSLRPTRAVNYAVVVTFHIWIQD